MKYLLIAIITLVPPQVQFFPKNMIFVVDTSGSMDGSQITDAMSAFMLFAGQPTDEMKIKVLAFQEHSQFWTTEWTHLPDVNALEGAKAWLIQVQATRSLGGTTGAVFALERAMMDDEPQLGIVLISDGIFDDSSAISMARLEALRASRGRVVGTVVVGDGDAQVMKDLGKSGGGGCYRLTFIGQGSGD